MVADGQLRSSGISRLRQVRPDLPDCLTNRVSTAYINTFEVAHSPPSASSLTMMDREAIYLPPSELAARYKAGIRGSAPIQPHPSARIPGSTLIKKVENFYIRPRWLFVRIETEGGVVGWGEGTLEGHTEAVQGTLKDIERR